MCIHGEHALVSNYPTTYSRQSCRSCLLSHYSHKTPKPPQHPKLPSNFQLKNPASKEVATVHTQQGCSRDGNDIRPGEVDEFLAGISKRSDVFSKHRATWEDADNEEAETENEGRDENLLVTEAPSPTAPSAQAKRREDNSFNNTLLQDRNKQHFSTQQFYKTTTQKLYEGADWYVFLKPRTPAPLHTREPDLKYPLNKIQWKNEPLVHYQALSGQRSWDSFQFRETEGKENQALAFTSMSKKTQQIPNYSGTIGGFGEKDMNIRPFQSLSCVRTSKPRYIETSRKPHIPGYAGFTATNQADDVFSAEPHPRAETTAASFSRLDGYEAAYSQHRHCSPLSKTVTKVHPFNPFNRVSYALNRTVGENRV